MRYLADTVAGRVNKALVIVGNTGCGKSSSMAALARTLATPEGAALFEQMAGAAVPPPRLEYINCADVPAKLLLAAMTERLGKASAAGGFAVPSAPATTIAAAAAAAPASRTLAAQQRAAVADKENVEAAMHATVPQLLEALLAALAREAELRAASPAAGRFCVLVLDEVDAAGPFWRKKGGAMERVVGQMLAVRSAGVILIANSMVLRELPDAATQYLEFSAYNHPELESIAQQRVATGGVAFNDKAMSLAAKSVVANNSGDARRMIDLCRATVADAALKRAREPASADAAASAATSAGPRRKTVLTVAATRNRASQRAASSDDAAGSATATTTATAVAPPQEIAPRDVMTAIRAASAHPGIAQLDKLTRHQHLALCCVANEMTCDDRRLTRVAGAGGAGAPSASARQVAGRGVDFNRLYALYQRLTSRVIGCATYDRSNFRDNLGTLVDYGILACEGSTFTMAVHRSEIQGALERLGVTYNLSSL